MKDVEKALRYLIEVKFPEVLLRGDKKDLKILQRAIKSLKAILGYDYVFNKAEWETNFRGICKDNGIDLWIVSWNRWEENYEV